MIAGEPDAGALREMLVGSAVSRDISTRDEGGAERSWLSGDRDKT